MFNILSQSVSTWQGLLTMIFMLCGSIFGYAKVAGQVDTNEKKNVEQDHKLDHLEAQKISCIQNYSHSETKQAVLENELKNVNEHLEELKDLLKILIKEK